MIKNGWGYDQLIAGVCRQVLRTLKMARLLEQKFHMVCQMLTLDNLKKSEQIEWTC